MTTTTSRMTSRERILAAMRREEVDHVPCAVHFNPLTEPQRVGYRWQFPFGPSDRERCEYCLEVLGIDAFVHLSVPIENPAPGVSCRVWMEGDVIHKAYSTPAGTLHGSVRYDSSWPHGFDIPFFSDHLIGHAVEHWVETEQDVAALKCVLRPPEDRQTLERTRFEAMEKKRLADRLQIPIISSGGKGLTGAMQLVGASEVCLMAAEKPEVLHAWLEYEHGLNLRTIELAAELGAHIISRNGFYETADFYGPAMLEDFLGDRLRREARATRALGLASSYTAHTGLMPILDYLATLEFDCLFGSDIAFHDMDVVRFRDRLHERFSFWTGPSSTYHIWKSAEATRAAVRRCFEVFGPRGFILGPAVSVHSIMPWENAVAMIDEWKKLAL